MEHPVSNVHWVPRDQLHANDYNPNHVAPPELSLLAHSILEDGWTQPIVAYPDGTIVDGFHRYMVSERSDIAALSDGKVPVVYVNFDPMHAKMSTVRHNRARGTHAVTPMATLVRNMIEEGLSVEQICAGLGMEDEEVYRLADSAGMPVNHGQDGFGHAWVPDNG